MASLAVFAGILPDQRPAHAQIWRPAEVTMQAFDPRTETSANPIPAGRLGPAYRLSSDTEAFGGFSGAAWLADTLYLVSDRGTLWRAEAEFGADGALAMLRDWQWASVADPKRRGQLDLEALTLSPDGRLFVAVEGRHRLYELIAGAEGYDIQALPTPDILAPSPRNRGIEAIATRDGRGFLAISEGLLRPDGRHAGVLVGVTGQGHEEMREFGYPAATGFAPTDIAWPAEGPAIVLERRFGLLSGWQARISALELSEDGTANRVPLIELDQGLQLDNFEGLAIRQDDGRHLATIVSDDNFLFLQSTLLFDLPLP